MFVLSCVGTPCSIDGMPLAALFRIVMGQRQRLVFATSIFCWPGQCQACTHVRACAIYFSSKSLSYKGFGKLSESTSELGLPTEACPWQRLPLAALVHFQIFLEFVRES